MELDAHRHQEVGGCGQLGAAHDLVEHGSGQGRGAQRMHVAQSSVRLLEVGLEEEGDRSVAVVTLGDGGGQDRQPAAGALSPELVDPVPYGLGDSGVASDEAGVEQSEGRPQAVFGHRHHLLGSADAVVEVDALVPHGVPEGVGDRPHLASPVVQEDDVEVAAGRQLSPSVAAGGQQGQAVVASFRRAAQQVGQPVVGLGRVGPTELAARQSRLGEQRGASGLERDRLVGHVSGQSAPRD